MSGWHVGGGVVWWVGVRFGRGIVTLLADPIKTLHHTSELIEQLGQPHQAQGHCLDLTDCVCVCVHRAMCFRQDRGKRKAQSDGWGVIKHPILFSLFQF